MEKIFFVGAYDKLDMLIYVAKIFTTMRKKVLIVDATTMQKSRYIIPSISQTPAYITNFEDIDVAIGLGSYENVKQYLGLSQNSPLPYDYVFIDTDKGKFLENWDIYNSKKNFFVTSFDEYSLKKGLASVANLKETIEFTKILFSIKMLQEENQYLDYLFLEQKTKWNDYRIYFPVTTADMTAVYENQKSQKIFLRRLSNEYRDGLAYVAQAIEPDTDMQLIKKAMRIIERGV